MCCSGGGFLHRCVWLLGIAELWLHSTCNTRMSPGEGAGAQVLATDYSAAAAAAVMNRLAKLSARFIGERGFSIGIDDVTPAPVLQRRKQQIIAQSYALCEARASAPGAAQRLVPHASLPISPTALSAHRMLTARRGS